jgi:SAM-dependent methyltransferase
VGVYANKVLPRIVHVACGNKQIAPLRARVCAGLTGDVVEIGFGSGSNVPFYPAGVTGVAAIEPADLGWQLAEQRVRESSVPIQRSGLDGQRLPFPDNTFDSALSTFTLCTIPDAQAALLEVRRVLKPGGEFHFVEHGRAPDESVRRWQHRLEPLHRLAFGGCRLTRPIPDLITGAGFTPIEIDCFYEDVGPKYSGAIALGVAAPGL